MIYASLASFKLRMDALPLTALLERNQHPSPRDYCLALYPSLAGHDASPVSYRWHPIVIVLMDT